MQNIIKIDNRYWKETEASIDSEYTTSGVWVKGVWVKGYWLSGKWIDGIWISGTLFECHWEKGVWVSGIWNYGMMIKNGWWDISRISPKSHYKPKLTFSLNYAKYN